MTDRPPGPDGRPTPMLRRRLMSRKQKDLLFAALLLNEKAHLSTTGSMAPEEWGELSPAHALIWRAVTKHFADHGTLPGLPVLSAELAEQDNQAFDSMDGFRGEIDDVLAGVFSKFNRPLADDPRVPAKVVKLTKQFLEDAVAVRYSKAMFDGDTLPASPTEMAAQLQEGLRKAGAVSRPNVDQVFPDGWDEEPGARPVPTGVKVFDRYTDGGLAPDLLERLLVMAPYGACKTVLAVQATIAAARRCRANFRETGEKKVAVFVSTEMDTVEARLRMVTHGAGIPRKRWAATGTLKALSRATKPGATPETAYELARFADAAKVGDGFVSEYDRAADLIDLVNTYVVFLDFTGRNPAFQDVEGKIEDAAVMIDAELSRRPGDTGVEIVTLDHLSAMVARLTSRSTQGKDPKWAEWNYLRTIPSAMKDIICAKYVCPSILFHQLSGEANSAPPWADLDHTSASLCRSVGEFVDWAMVFGKPTDDDARLARVKMSKFRRMKAMPYGVVQIDGEYGTVVDVSDKYEVDPRAKGFFEIEGGSAADRFEGADEVAPPAAAAYSASVDLGPG